jgi:hypothetical protein
MLQVAWRSVLIAGIENKSPTRMLCVPRHCSCVTVGAQVQHCWIPCLRDIVSVSALDEDVALEVQDVYSSTGVRHGCWWARKAPPAICEGLLPTSHHIRGSDPG